MARLDLLDDCLHRLRFYGDITIRTELNTESDEKQSDVVIDLSQCRHRTSPTAATRPLFDSNCWWNPGHRIEIRTRRRLNKLSRVSVDGFQIPFLSFSEKNIESDGTLAATTEPSYDGHRIVWNRQTDLFQITLPSISYAYPTILDMIAFGSAIRYSRILLQTSREMSIQRNFRRCLASFC